MAAKNFLWQPKPLDLRFTHIRLPEVCEMIFRKQSFIYDGTAKGTFPTPSKLSPAINVWRKEEVLQWLVDSAKSIGSGVVEGTANE